MPDLVPSAPRLPGAGGNGSGNDLLEKGYLTIASPSLAPMSAPHPDHWIWGIDLSTTAVDLVVVNHQGEYQHIPSLARGTVTVPERLLAQLDQTTQFATAMASHFPPLAVYVELPTGLHPNPPLMMACGVVQAALERALQTQPHRVGIHTIAVSAWKKAAVGNGNASKEAVLAWARALGYDGDRQDGADALGVATFASWETRRELPTRPRSFAGASA